MHPTLPISRLPVSDLASLSGDFRQVIGEGAEKPGFVSDVFRALAHRPAAFRAFCADHRALTGRAAGLNRLGRKVIMVATSGLNRCQSCIVGYGAIWWIWARHSPIADQVAINWRKADLVAPQPAMPGDAGKVTLNARDIGDEKPGSLPDAGFSQDESRDIGAMAAFFGMSRWLVNAGDIRPNDEYYMPGRG